MIISVIGSSAATAEQADLAWEVGRLLASRGATVACGGLGGVMEAVCGGARSAGGTTVGVLPGSDPSIANVHVDIPVCTGIGYARNVIVVKTGGSVIAIGGAFGTLSEIGHALAEGVPVVGLDTWEISQPGVLGDPIRRARDPEEAVELALAAARERPSRPAPTAEELRS